MKKECVYCKRMRLLYIASKVDDLNVVTLVDVELQYQEQGYTSHTKGVSAGGYIHTVVCFDCRSVQGGKIRNRNRPRIDVYICIPHLDYQ
jgi:hypothetical protein